MCEEKRGFLEIQYNRGEFVPILYVARIGTKYV